MKNTVSSTAIRVTKILVGSSGMRPPGAAEPGHDYFGRLPGKAPCGHPLPHLGHTAPEVVHRPKVLRWMTTGRGRANNAFCNIEYERHIKLPYYILFIKKKR